MGSGNRYGDSIQIVWYQEIGLRKIRKRDGDRRRLGLVEARRSSFGSGRERSNSWRKSLIPSIRIWISVIFKAISQIFRGMGSVNLKIRFWKIETKYKGINRRFPHTIVRKVWFTYWNLFDFLFGYRLVIEEITLRESGFSGDDLRSGGMSFGVYYIKCFGVGYLDILSFQLKPSKYTKVQSFYFFLLSMTQSVDWYGRRREEW